MKGLDTLSAWKPERAEDDDLRLDTKRFGIACGLTLSLFTEMIGCAAWWFDWGTELVEVASSLYIGFEPNGLGVFIGGVWGFVDGFIGGVLLAWVYNRTLPKRTELQKTESLTEPKTSE